MGFAIPKNERFAVAPVFPEDGAGRKAEEGLRPDLAVRRPTGWPDGLRRSCHPETRDRQTVLSLAPRPGLALPGPPSQSLGMAAREAAADDKADHTLRRSLRRMRIHGPMQPRAPRLHFR